MPTQWIKAIVHTDEKWWIVGKWVVDDNRTDVNMGFGLVDLFEFWEYKITWFDMDSNDWGLWRVRKHVPEIETGIIWLLPWVQSEEDKDGHIEDYRRAQRIALDKTSISKNAGQYNLEKLILNSM